MSEDEPIIILLAKLAKKDGVAPISQFADCWERQIGQWKIAFNGHSTPRKCTLVKKPLPSFSCYVEFNGWPAGLIDPSGGIIAAGSAANENTFADAINAEISS